ncbi:MAG TPA: PA2779 family protein [Burkholderiales bacterium]
MKKLLTSLTLALLLVAPQVQAGMIGTQDEERQRVKELVARPELAQQLEQMGIAPEEVQARIDAMTDEEVRTLAGRLNAVPAGGDLTTQEWLLIIIVILLVIILL